jgi:hypothetical protein
MKSVTELCFLPKTFSIVLLPPEFLLLQSSSLLLLLAAANKWYQTSQSCATLDSIHYTRLQNMEFGAMDPNMKLVLNELMKLRTEMKDRFVSQEAAFTKRLNEVTAEDRIRDARVTNLEESSAVIDKSFPEWRPELHSSITTIKLELSKRNTFFDRDARTTSSPSGLIPVGSAAAHPVAAANADGPVGHHVDMNHRDVGFGHVFTHTHVLVMGTIHPLKSPARIESLHGTKLLRGPSADHDARVQIGKLPKINFSRFEGDNPVLWQSRCVSYFDIYGVDSSVWVKVASMHFNGPATRWLQLVDRCVRTASWKELCS